VVPDVTERAVWDAVDPGTRGALLARADAELTRDAPAPPVTGWARVFARSGHTPGEEAAVRLRERVTLFVLASVLTDDIAPATAPRGASPYLDAAVEGLTTLTETTTWGLPPHARQTAPSGEVLPDPEEPFVDLGAAEITSLFAWTDHVLGPHLDIRAPGLRRRLRREVSLRVLTPFEHTRDLRSPEGDARWNPWIHGAILAAALLLVEDRRRRERLVALAVEGLNHFAATLPDDGGVEEGVAYWWHGPCRLLEALDLLAEAGMPGGEQPGLLTELIRFPHRMHLGGEWYVNAGDAPPQLPAGEPWHVLHRWGERLGDEDVRAHAVCRGREQPLIIRPEAGLGRALTGLTDEGWREAAPAEPDGWLPREVWLPRVQILVAREMAGTPEGLTLAMKAGHNGERRNHLDVGSYWVALDGVPVVVDVGQPAYTTGSPGPDRRQAWPLLAEWHNLPEPGVGQQAGGRYRARDVHAETGVDQVELRADLAGAYPAGLLTRWQRSARLVRDPAHIVIEENWAPRRGIPVLMRHILAGRVELGESWALVHSAGTLRISWRDATPELDHRVVDDPLLRRSWGESLTRLTLRVPDTGAFSIRIERAATPGA
jgi:hypothetical protein